MTSRQTQAPQLPVHEFELSPSASAFAAAAAIAGVYPDRGVPQGSGHPVVQVPTRDTSARSRKGMKPEYQSNLLRSAFWY